jgi:predicted ABC-type transport system involved in lysophospholipase L1 biosynthesis ATPase subunit
MIQLRGVSKIVPSGPGLLTILHPLDLHIPAGRVVAITGRPAAASPRCSASSRVSTPRRRGRS